MESDEHHINTTCYFMTGKYNRCFILIKLFISFFSTGNYYCNNAKNKNFTYKKLTCLVGEFKCLLTEFIKTVKQLFLS